MNRSSRRQAGLKGMVDFEANVDSCLSTEEDQPERGRCVSGLWQGAGVR
jgi:hypothetical protein